VRVVAFDGSPTGGGRTLAVLEAVLVGTGSETVAVGLETSGVEAALAEAERADAFVFGSPVYRATYAAPLKSLLDALPRDMWGEQSAPVTGRAVAIVATGASFHHFLALDSLRNVLAGFFAAHVVPPGLYVPREGFGEDGSLSEEYAELARLQGRALVELAQALERSQTLRALKPQA
jgi:FMN reductase